MSGGYFNYKQFHIDQIADDIEYLIENENYSEEVIDEFKKGLIIIRKAYTYVQRIDWLVSADDSEESFLKNLKKELEEDENISHKMKDLK